MANKPFPLYMENLTIEYEDWREIIE